MCGPPPDQHHPNQCHDPYHPPELGPEDSNAGRWCGVWTAAGGPIPAHGPTPHRRVTELGVDVARDPEPDWVSQKWWTEKSHVKASEKLRSQLCGRDLVRLQCQDFTNVGAWLRVIPSRAMGLELPPCTFQILLKWWLGQELVSTGSPSEASPPATCPFCQSAADHYGDHFVCCKKVDYHPRHEAVVEQIARFCQASGLKPTMDVAIEGRLRPADVFLPHYTEEPTAVASRSPTRWRRTLAWICRPPGRPTATGQP